MRIGWYTDTYRRTDAGLAPAHPVDDLPAPQRRPGLGQGPRPAPARADGPSRSGARRVPGRRSTPGWTRTADGPRPRVRRARAPSTSRWPSCPRSSASPSTPAGCAGAGPSGSAGCGGSPLLRGYLGEALTARDLIEPGLYSMTEVLVPTMVDYAPADLAAEMVPRDAAGRRDLVPGLLRAGHRQQPGLAGLPGHAPTATRWRVTGQKVWTSLAQYAQRCVLLTRTGTPESAHRGITALFVDMDTPGITVRPIETLHGVAEFCRGLLRRRRGARRRARWARSAGAGPWPWTCSPTSAARRCGTAAPSCTGGSAQLLADRARRARSTAAEVGDAFLDLHAFRARSRATQHRLARRRAPRAGDLDRQGPAGHGRAGALRPGRRRPGRRRAPGRRRRRRAVALRVPLLAGRHHLRRQRRDPAQHHRQAPPRPRAATDDGRRGPRAVRPQPARPPPRTNTGEDARRRAGRAGLGRRPAEDPRGGGRPAVRAPGRGQRHLVRPRPGAHRGASASSTTPWSCPPWAAPTPPGTGGRRRRPGHRDPAPGRRPRRWSPPTDDGGLAVVRVDAARPRACAPSPASTPTSAWSRSPARRRPRRPPRWTPAPGTPPSPPGSGPSPTSWSAPPGPCSPWPATTPSSASSSACPSPRSRPCATAWPRASWPSRPPTAAAEAAWLDGSPARPRPWPRPSPVAAAARSPATPSRCWPASASPPSTTSTSTCAAPTRSTASSATAPRLTIELGERAPRRPPGPRPPAALGAGEAEDVLGDDVALDLGGAAGDGAGEAAQVEVEPAVGRRRRGSAARPAALARRSGRGRRGRAPRACAAWRACTASEPSSFRIDCSVGSMPLLGLGQRAVAEQPERVGVDDELPNQSSTSASSSRPRSSSAVAAVVDQVVEALGVAEPEHRPLVAERAGGHPPALVQRRRRGSRPAPRRRRRTPR